MTLKCSGLKSYCNQINLESPLHYLDGPELQPILPGGDEGSSWATASGVVRGWLCSMAPVPTEYVSVPTEYVSLKASLGTSHTPSAGHPTRHEIEVTTAAQNQSTHAGTAGTVEITGPTGTTIIVGAAGITTTNVGVTRVNTGTIAPLATSQTLEDAVPTQTPSSVLIQSEEEQFGDYGDDAYGWELESDDVESDEWFWDEYDEDDCGCEEAAYTWEEPCLDDYVDVSPRSLPSPHEHQRRSESGFGPASQPPSSSIREPNSQTTGGATFTRHVRPLVTMIASAAPDMTITEAVFIASTAFANQSSQSPFREATDSMSILWPTQDSNRATASGHSNPTAVPKATFKSNPGVTAEVAGSITAVFGFVVVLASVYLFYRRRRRKQEQRWRERREANPVSSRITTTSGW